MDYSFNAEGRLTSLKQRVSRCVCKYCGSPLKLRRIVFSRFEDARVEVFCSRCDRIEHGVEPEVYACAKYFVDEFSFNVYPDLDENEATTQFNVAKVCEIIDWSLRNMGYLSEEGYVEQPQICNALVAECLSLTNRDLDAVDTDFDLDIEE